MSRHAITLGALEEDDEFEHEAVESADSRATQPRAPFGILGSHHDVFEVEAGGAVLSGDEAPLQMGAYTADRRAPGRAPIALHASSPLGTAPADTFSDGTIEMPVVDDVDVEHGVTTYEWAEEEPAEGAGRQTERDGATVHLTVGVDVGPGSEPERERELEPEPEAEPEPEPGPESSQHVDNPLAAPVGVEAPPAPPTPQSSRESSRRRAAPRTRQVVQVTVPDGAYPGCRLEVLLPDGSTLSVMVPEGAEAGSVIQATVPTAGQTPLEAPSQTESEPNEQGPVPPEPSELIDWELFSRRRQHLGIGLSVIGAVLLCLAVLHYMEYAQLLKEHEPDASFGCGCEPGGCQPCTKADQERWAQQPRSSLSGGAPLGVDDTTNAHCNPVCLAFEHYKDTLEVRELKDGGDAMVEWGLLLCILAAPLVLGMREFTKALIGSCCCCCIDMSTFLTQSETCSMLFIRILIINWCVVFISRDEAGRYWQGCVFAGAVLHLLFSLAAVAMSRSNSRRAELPAPSRTRANESEAAAATADAGGAAATEEGGVEQRVPAPPGVSVARSAPSLLRCGKCAEIFGLPPGTPADAAARCPHCSTVNRQPPTFMEKHARLQDRLYNLRVALQRQRRSRHASKLRLRVTRENVLADSFSHLRGVDGTLVASLPLSVQFDGEEGLDQGGVTREWMCLLMQAVLDPQVALFSTSNENYVYQINSNSHVNPEHLDYFNFLGKLLAKCICDGITTPFSHFTPDVYNVLLQRPTYFSDLQVIDADIYRSLQWILENNVDDLGLTFVADEEEFGMIRQVALKEGGKDIKVTEENKREFVELKAKYTMVDRKIDQLTAVSMMRCLSPFHLHAACRAVRTLTE